METVPMKLKSGSFTISVYDDRVEIKTDKGVEYKTIFLNQITGIVFRDPIWLNLGQMTFTIAGNVSSFMSRISPVIDENTFYFKKQDIEEAKKIKLKIEELIRNQSKLNETKCNDPDPDILRKYKQLFDDGIITEEEFKAKKKEILGF